MQTCVPTACESPLIRREAQLCSPRNRFEIYDSLDRDDDEEEEEFEEDSERRWQSHRQEKVDLKPRFLQCKKKVPCMLARPDINVINVPSSSSSVSSETTLLEISWKLLSERDECPDVFHLQQQDLRTGIWKMWASNQCEEISEMNAQIRVCSDISCRLRFRVRGKSSTCGSLGPWSKPSKAIRLGPIKVAVVRKKKQKKKVSAIVQQIKPGSYAKSSSRTRCSLEIEKLEASLERLDSMLFSNPQYSSSTLLDDDDSTTVQESYRKKDAFSFLISSKNDTPTATAEMMTTTTTTTVASQEEEKNEVKNGNLQQHQRRRSFRDVGSRVLVNPSAKALLSSLF